MKVEKINQMGMELEQWTHESCIANFGVNDNEKWSTLYDIHSREEGKGHATVLLTEAKKHYEDKGYKFGGSVALNERMKNIYRRLGIEEFE